LNVTTVPFKLSGNGGVAATVPEAMKFPEIENSDPGETRPLCVALTTVSILTSVACAGLTLNDCPAVAAAAYVASPGWLAVR
jgi:hypothetical protein